MARKVFEWDAADDKRGNVSHIARHDVTPEEAEYVLLHPLNKFERSASSSYPITFGRTRAGRFLAVVWYAVGNNPEVVRVVTAYPVARPKGRH